MTKPREEERAGNDDESSILHKWIISTFLLMSVFFMAFAVSYYRTSGNKNDIPKNDNYLKNNVSQENVNKKITGIYEHANGGKLIVREDGECYIHLQEPDQECQYETFIEADGRVEFDIELISHDFPGTGGGFEGEYKDGNILIEVPWYGDLFVYEKVN